MSEKKAKKQQERAALKAARKAARTGAAPPASGRLDRLWNAWHGFWFQRIDPFILGCYRICLGLALLLYYIFLTPSWQEFYGPDGMFIAALQSPEQTYFFESPLRHISTEWGMWAVYGISLASALCLCLGILGRVPIVWLWFCNFALQQKNLLVACGEEQVLAVLLFFSMFLPLDAVLTLPRYLARARGEDVPRPDKVTVWALRPLQIWFAAIYAFSLPWKLTIEPAWYDGTLIYYATLELTYSRWPGNPIFAWLGAVLSHIASWFTLLVELFFPFLVWFRKLRLPFVLSMAMLHVGIGVLLEGVMFFNVVMLVGLVIFLPSRRTREWLTGDDERGGTRQRGRVVGLPDSNTTHPRGRARKNLDPLATACRPAPSVRDREAGEPTNQAPRRAMRSDSRRRASSLAWSSVRRRSISAV